MQKNKTKMSGCEELEFNRYYQLLQTKFSRSYNEALKRCYVICIPSTNSLRSVQDVRKDFVDLHILKPSPLFKGQYITTDQDQPRALMLENNLFTARQGFQRQFQVKVITEERGYNKDLKPYRILVIERPFISDCSMITIEANTTCDSTSNEDYNFDPRYSECVQYLKKFPECSGVMNLLEEETRRFSDNYMIIRGFLHEAADKLRELWASITKLYMETVTSKRVLDQRIQTNVSRAIESCILHHVHQKLFPIIREEKYGEDIEYQEKLSVLRGLPPEALGVKKSCCCPQTLAVQELNGISSCKTPLDVLVCLCNTFDAVTKTINCHFLDRGSDNDKDPPLLTSDDYIPLILHVLTQTDPLHMVAVMYFIDNFHWTSPDTDRLGYSYVTFQAVVHYLGTLDTHHVVRQYRAQHVQTQTPSKVPVTKDIPEPITRQRRRDRRLDRITKMLESSTEDFASANQETDLTALMTRTHLTKSKKTPGLGEFLSSLGDGQSTSFGKQT